jgi:hypothetical protein
MRVSVIIPAGIIILILAIPGYVLAASDDDMKFYAAGDPVYISGEAPGSQSTGLVAWIFGQNYWSTDSVNTRSDGSYTYEIGGGLTGSLSSGQYFVVIQHPMYNGIFDVTVQEGSTSSGQTLVVSTAGESFVISGPGKLKGSAAAYALMNLLDSQNIDDTYTVTTFFLEEPWLKADATETWVVGSVFSLEGTTNVAPGERLIYTFSPASGDFPSSKQSGESPYSTEITGQTDVEYGMPYNLWNVRIDTEGMGPGTYIFTIEAVSEGITIQKYITLYEPVSTPEITGRTTTQASPTYTKALVTYGTTTATETPQASAPVYLVIFSISAAVLTAATGRNYRRR